MVWFVCNDYHCDSSVTGMLDNHGWHTLAERWTKCTAQHDEYYSKVTGSRVAINKHDNLDESNTRTRSNNRVKQSHLSARSLVYKI